MEIQPFKDLPSGDGSEQFRMTLDKGYVDFAILNNELCAHTWQCPGEGKAALSELECFAFDNKLNLTIPTVLNPRLEKILRDNGYTMKSVPYMDDVCELWSKDAQVHPNPV